MRKDESMTVVRRRWAWNPTHRVLLVAGENQSIQSVQVMLTGDGFAYTRFQWDNVLLPALRQSTSGRWVLNGHSELAVAGYRTAMRVLPLEPSEDGCVVAS